MFKKNKKDNYTDSSAQPKSNFFLSTIISLIFDFFKDALHDFQNNRKINKIDKFEKEFSNLEHIVIKTEEKINEARREIEKLKNSLLIQNLVIILLLIVIVARLFY